MATLLFFQGGPIAPTIPPTEWFAHYGPLGIIFMVLIAAALMYIYLVDLPARRAAQKAAERRQESEILHQTEMQRLDREHTAARQEIEIVRERKGLELFETLRVGFVADQQYKTTMTETQAKQTMLVQKLAESQEKIAGECAAIGQTVRMISSPLTRPAQCQNPDCLNPLDESWHYIDKMFLCDTCAAERLQLKNGR